MHGHACVGTRDCYLEVYMAEYKTVIIKDQMKGSSKSWYYLHIKQQVIAISKTYKHLKEQSLQGCNNPSAYYVLRGNDIGLQWWLKKWLNGFMLKEFHVPSKQSANWKGFYRVKSFQDQLGLMLTEMQGLKVSSSRLRHSKF